MRGSVYKRCPCAVVRNARGDRVACKIEHGSWTYVADLGLGPEGKRQQQRRGGYATRDAAEEALHGLLTRVAAGQYHADERKTLEEWLTEWVEAKVRAGLARLDRAVLPAAHQAIPRPEPGAVPVAGLAPRAHCGHAPRHCGQ